MSAALILVLASASPRRSDLLDSLGLRYEKRPVDLDESLLAGEKPGAYVLRLAREKAAARAEPGEIVLAADTTVVCDTEVMGKPRDDADARRMLGRLAGREHEVLTGVAVHDPAARRTASDCERTRVRIASMTDAEIAWYVETGEPRDKAGAYAIQGLGALFVDAVAGNYTNVVGLPLPLVRRLVAEIGFDLRAFRRRRPASRRT